MANQMVNNVQVMEEYDGVKVINICKLIDYLFGEMAWQRYTYRQQSEGIRKWVKENDASYYSDCKENFFIWKGVDKAKKEGKQIVVVENLS